jgi:adenylate cyclase
MLYRFNLCLLDLVRGRLCVDGEEASLRPKSFEVLRYLVQNPGRLILKDDLIKAVWPNTIVTDESLTNCVSDVRRAIGDRGQTIIKTVPRRGYVFTAAVAQESVAPGPSLDTGALDRAVPEKPSIAVLAFANMSGDPSQEYYSDGITEDIITELSRFSELFVIARNSSFRYKGQQVDVRQIGKELGARYVLEGSVRRAGDRVRVTAQLIDATTGTHRWAEHYDRELEDVFAVQDEVARAIVAILAAHVNRAEAERALLKPPTTWQAHDYYLRGAVTFARYRSSYNIEQLYEARALLERSIGADPNYARSHALLAGTHLNAYLNAVDTDYRNPLALERAYERARKAVQLDPDLPLGHAVLADALGFKQRFDESISEFERALALNPNFSYFQYSMVLVMAGEPLRAIEVVKAHTRLDPFYEPLAPFMLGMAFYMLRNCAEAVAPLRETVLRAPRFMQGHLWLAATYAQLGLLEEARAEVAQALEILPSYTIPTAPPFKQRADAEHLLAGLRKAGLPESG